MALSVSAVVASCSSAVSTPAVVPAPPPATITGVIVTPSDAAVLPAGTSHFIARVVGTGDFSHQVVWSLEPDDAGTAPIGSIGIDGTYSAPADVPPGIARFRVVATSVSGITGFARVRVPTAPLMIVPETASVFLGDTQQFQAMLYGTADPTVTWHVLSGTVDSNGLYRAPTVAYPGDTAEVVAHSPGLGLEARATVLLKLLPPVLTGLSGPAGPGDRLTVYGTNFLQAPGIASVVVLFPGGGRDEIEVGATLFEPYTDRFDVVVPIGAVSGPLRVALPPL